MNPGEKSSSPGMPSLHAQVVGLTAVFWSIYICKNESSFSDIFRVAMLFGIFFAVSYQRVIVCCETWLQVGAGAFFGIVCGILFYYIVEKFDLIDDITVNYLTNKSKKKSKYSNNNFGNNNNYNSL